MKKIQLNVEALRVDSFETVQEREERGTVDGHQIGTYGGACTQTTCKPYHCFCTEQQTCRCV